MNEIQKKATEIIFDMERKANSHWQEKDVEWISNNILTPETVQLTPGMPPLDGEGYSAWMRQLSEMEGINFSFVPTEVVVSESGEMAYVLGETKLEEDGKPARIGKFVSVWRNFDGQWRCAVEANNFNDA